MKISKLLHELSQEGNTIANVAKDKVGIAEKRLRFALKSAGYQFNNKGKKGWYYVGDGVEPLDKSILEYVTSGKSNSHKSNKQVIKHSQDNSHSSHNEVAITSQSELSKSNDSSITISNTWSEINFTYDEIVALKSMINEFMTAKTTQTNRDKLHLRIMQLQKGNRTRKTVVMSDDVAKSFDEFAAKMKFNKSDILELALMDFINSYKDE